MKNREIKFRSWIPLLGHDSEYPKIGSMPYWNLSAGSSVQVVEGEKYGTIMQFTGLKDKNGKEIYEGDIMRYLVHYPSDFQERNPKKKFHRISNGVQWEKGWLYLDYDGEENGDNTLLYEEEAKNWEIIGNIYENPDLLK